MKTPILDALGYNESRVLEVSVSDDKKIVTLTEACDQYFSKEFDKTAFCALITELSFIHSQMEF